MEAFNSLDSPFDEHSVLPVIVLMVSLLLPFFYVMFLPPDKLKINVKCVGILHDDYVEIYKGKKLKKQRYEDIKHIHSFSYNGTTWRIGKVSIHEAIGLRKSGREADLQLNYFINAVQIKKKMLDDTKNSS
jgi:hypothetical protein